MAQRRSLQRGMPAMPMTGTGTPQQMFDDRDDPEMQGVEHPDTRRRRLTPIVGMPADQPNAIQQLIAMLKGGPQ